MLLFLVKRGVHMNPTNPPGSTTVVYCMYTYLYVYVIFTENLNMGDNYVYMDYMYLLTTGH